MNKFRSICLFIPLITGSFAVYSQTPDSRLRSVLVTTPDSVIKASVWNKPDKYKPFPYCNYYWYYAGIVNHNLGGYSGKVLHGGYEVFDSQQKLRVKGNFDHGMMTGEWLRWHDNGNIQFTGFYKKGVLEGRAKTYSSDGKPSAILRYDHGVLDGKSVFFYRDTVIQRKYREGIEVVKKKKDSAKKEIKAKKKENERLKTDSIKSKSPRLRKTKDMGSAGEKDKSKKVKEQKDSNLQASTLQQQENKEIKPGKRSFLFFLKPKKKDNTEEK